MNRQLIIATKDNVELYYNFETCKFENEAEKSENPCYIDYLTADPSDLIRAKELAHKNGFPDDFIDSLKFVQYDK